LISKPIFNLKLLTILIVTITSEEGQHFKGFLLEARTNYDEEEAIGVWETRVKNTKDTCVPSAIPFRVFCVFRG
jgi:hypothetical protein